MGEQPRARSIWMDVAKGIGITGVVLVHATHWTDAEHPALTAAVRAVTIVFPVFFLVSGMLAAPGIVGPAADRRSLLRRLLPLFWLYALWQPAVLAYRLVGAVGLGRDVDALGEVARTLAAPIRPNGELWYLWVLGLHLALAYATRRLPAAAVLVPAFVVFLVTTGWGETIVGEQRWHILGPGLQGLPQLAFVTLLGVRYADPIRRAVERSGPSTAIVVLAAAIGLEWVVSTASRAVSATTAPLRIVLAVAAVVVLARSVERLGCTRVLAWIGERSGVVYVTHTLLVVLAVVVATPIGLPPLVAVAPIGTVLVTVSLVMAMALAGQAVLPPTVRTALFAAPPRVLALAGPVAVGRPPRGRRSDMTIRRARRDRRATAAARRPVHHREGRRR